MTTNKIGWNIYKFLSSLLILLWLLAKLYLLSQDMQGLNVFGGGMILVWLFPILSIFLLLSKKLQKHILAIITIVIGFIIVNYLDYYLAVSQHEFSIFVMLFISMLPFLLIFPPYVWLLNFILKEPEKFEAQEDKKLIINIKTMDGILFLLQTSAIFSKADITKSSGVPYIASTLPTRDSAAFLTSSALVTGASTNSNPNLLLSSLNSFM